MNKIYTLMDSLALNHDLDNCDLLYILKNYDEDSLKYLNNLADKERKKHYSNEVFIRGLIEISNYCKCDCLYCGIRNSNSFVKRYRLSSSEILECVKNAYELGCRTFVLQGGEDLYFNDDILIDLIKNIKNLYPDCAITLSLGERSFDSYKLLFNAGCNRYLLRHESINASHFAQLHPKKQTIESRIECLNNLKKIGYQVGCGMMINSPYQSKENIVEDLRFIKEFNPQMVGIGPYINHNETPFKDYCSGNMNDTLIVLSIVRLLLPKVLLPATTALNTISEKGRILGIKSGCNVIMPNVSPSSAIENYSLYNNKNNKHEHINNLDKIKEEMKKNGYQIIVDKGDWRG